MEGLSSAAIIAGSEAVKNITNDIYNLGKHFYKKRKIQSLNKKAFDTIYRKLQSVENVKTVWRVDEEVNLHNFYYPSKLSVPNSSTPITPKLIGDISNTHNIVIEGTAGQGKSILLRYLSSNEIKHGSRIPLFIELRKLKNHENFISSIVEKLENLGFYSDNETAEEFLTTGKLVLFLDGFDEVPEQLKSKLLTSLENLICRYEKSQFIITSRPGSGIQHSEYFRIVRVQELDNDDHSSFLKTVCDSEEQANNILKGIQKSKHEIQGLLRTPLLLTLLTVLYKADQHIPDNLIEFYNKLFYILFTKHDKTKPGFQREIKSQLTETRFEELFQYFCFLSRRRGETSFNRTEAVDFAKEATKQSRIHADEGKFLDDCCSVTCLMIEEGIDYHFIHKSVQEFYSAKFISNRTDKVSEKFYKQALNKTKHWNPELNFLEVLDTYRMYRYYLIPAAEELLKKLEKKDGIKGFIKGARLHIQIDGLICGFSSPQCDDLELYFVDIIIGALICIMQESYEEDKPYLEGKELQRLIDSPDVRKIDYSGDNETIISTSVFNALKFNKKHEELIYETVREGLISKLNKAQELLKQEEEFEDLMAEI